MKRWRQEWCDLQQQARQWWARCDVRRLLVPGPLPKLSSRVSMMSLALPIICLQLLSVAAGVFDSACLARLGTSALAANALCYRGYMIVLIFIAGVSMACGVRLAQSFGHPDKLWRLLWQCFYLALPLSCVCYFGLTVILPWLFHLSQQNPILLNQLSPYLWQLAMAAVLMLWLGIARQLLLVLNGQRWFYLLAICYLFSHIAFSYAFIFGHWGVAAFGLEGAGISEVLSVGLNLVLLLMLLYKRVRRIFAAENGTKASVIAVDWPYLYGLWRFIWPVASLLVGEMLALMMFVLLLGHFGTATLAAYQMVAQLGMLPLMIPYGVEMAVAIVVGKLLMQADHMQIQLLLKRTSYWTMTIMSVFSLLFLLFPQQLLQQIFHYHAAQHPYTVALAVKMLACVALYQLFDTLRKVLLGALRGMNDVRMPMFIALFCFWIIGLVSAVLLSASGLGAMGVWLGLTLAMISAAVGILWRYAGLQRQQFKLEIQQH